MCRIRLLILFTGIATTPIVFANHSTHAETPSPWRGFYVGANIGVGWGEANQHIALLGDWLTDGTGDDTFLTPFGNKALQPQSFLGGARIGYNYQVRHWVPGIIVGVDYLGEDTTDSTGVITGPPPSSNSYTLTSSYALNWLVTVRPRLGYVIHAFLPYITGGLAIACQQYSQNIMQHNVDYYENGSLNNTVYGWTVGAGTEYALAARWRIMIEYLFVALPLSSMQSSGVLGGTPYNIYHSTHAVQLDDNIMQLGFTYKFHE